MLGRANAEQRRGFLSLCAATRSPSLSFSLSTFTVTVTVGLLLSTSRCSPTRAAHAVVQVVQGSPGPAGQWIVLRSGRPGTTERNRVVYLSDGVVYLGRHACSVPSNCLFRA